MGLRSENAEKNRTVIPKFFTFGFIESRSESNSFSMRVTAL